VALVEHERDARGGIKCVRLDHLMHDPEQLERIGGAHHQVVVGVEAAVEVEAAQAVGAQQQGHDELDVRARGVVAGVHHHQGPGTQRLAVQQAGAPVGDVSGVEGRLEQLVLKQHPLARRQPRVDGRQRLGQAVLPGPDVVLARVVGAVGEPQFEVGRSGGVHDVDALEQVGHGLLAHPWVGVADAAQLVVVVLEDVGVDGADTDPEVAGVPGQRSVVIDLVPGNVHRHAGGDAGEPVNLGRVFGLLPRGTRHSRLAEYLEPCSAVPEGPGRQLDLMLSQGSLDGGRLTHSGSSPLPVHFVRAGCA
jgi:hypothetical protein